MPERWIPSAKAYGRYVKTIIMLNSKEGLRRNSTYFNKFTEVKENLIQLLFEKCIKKKDNQKDIKALAKAKATPIAAEAKNIRQKRPTPCKTSWPPLMLCNSGESTSRIVVVSTIATASFRILSPNTSIFNTGSTSRAWKIASVATGSTALISEPNAKLSMKLNL